jgi:hypothetical protein
MTKKAKQSKKAAKGSKRTKLSAQPNEESDTASTSTPAAAPQPAPAIPEVEVTVGSQQTVAAPAPANESGTAPKTTRSETAKANIKEGLKQHALAGRPTKTQLVLVFGTKGYAMTWPQRTAKFGITPETFQAALAKGVQATPLAPVAEQSKKS